MLGTGRNIMLIFLLISLLSPALFAVNINASCISLVAASTSYFMTQDITGQATTCFVVSADNVVLDCQGHSIIGTNQSNTYGVSTTSSGTTVKNCRIGGFHNGVYLNGATATDALLQNNTINSSYSTGSAIMFNVGAGVSLYTVLINNTAYATGGYPAIYLLGASRTNFTNNSATGAYGQGIQVHNSANNVFLNNRFSSNTLNGVLNYGSNYNIYLGNFFYSDSGFGVLISAATNAIRNNFTNNTFYSNVSGVFIGDNRASNSTFYGNRFYAGLGYINNTDTYGDIFFNTTVGGVAQGNYYENILNISISDADYNGFGDSGAEYPYNGSNSGGKWIGNGSDYGPVGALQGNPVSACTVISSPGNYSVIRSFSTDAHSCINVTSGGVRLDCGYFEMTGTGNGATAGVGINVSNLGFVSIQNCLLRNFSTGIRLNSTIYSNVTNTTITNATTGIWLSGRTTNVSSDNRIEYSTLKNNSAYGIYLSDDNTDYNTIRGTNITNSTFGIFIDASDSNNFTNMLLLDNNRTTSAAGVYIDSTSRSNFFINMTSINNYAGIYNVYTPSASDSDNMLVNNSVFSRSQGTGVVLSSSANYVIIDNTLFNSSDTGFFLMGASAGFPHYINITNSNFSGNNYGLFFTRTLTSSLYGTGVNIRNARIYNSTISAVSSNTFTGGRNYFNVSIFNNTAGITAGDADILDYVYVYDNRNDGITLQHSFSLYRNVVNNSMAYNNTGHGITSGDANRFSTINNTEIFNNTKWGVYMGTSQNTIIDKSTIHHNAWGGAYINNGSEVMNSSITDNTGQGVYISPSAITYSDLVQVKNSYIASNLGGLNTSALFPIRIENSTFVSNTYFGINLTYANSTNLTNNTLGFNTVDILNATSNITYAFDNACNSFLNFRDFGTASGCTWPYPRPIFVTSCTNITSSVAAGTTYYLTADISSWGGLTCFNISQQNITLDLQGHIVNGTNLTSAHGVHTRAFNTTVKNGIIDRFQHGAYFDQVQNGTIQNITSMSRRTSGDGIYLNRVNYTSIINSTGISTTTEGIYLINSNSNTIKNSTGLGEGQGILLTTSTQSQIINSTGTSTGSGTGAGIYLLTNADDNLIIGSLAGSTGSYGLTIDSSSYNQLISTNSTKGIDIESGAYNNLTGVNSTSSGYGLLITTGTYNRIENSTFTSTGSQGIRIITTASNNWIINTNVTTGASYAVVIATGSIGNNVIGSRIASGTSSAFYSDSNDNAVANSTFTSNSASQGAFYIPGSVSRFNITNSTVIAYSGFGLNAVDTATLRVIGGYISAPSNTAINLTNVDSSLFQNITINATSLCMNISATSLLNSIALNYFYNCSIYINNSGATNMFNLSVGGVARGNFYDTIQQYSIIDSNGDNYGDSGDDYPFSVASSGGKLIGTVSDWGPIGSRQAVTACQNLNTANGYYVLGADISSAAPNCFNITAGGITLDGLGRAINGTAGSGIALNGTTGVIIKHLRIGGFADGISARAGSNSCTFLNITVSGASRWGMNISGSDLCTITNSTINASTAGIYLFAATNATVRNNTASSSGAAINISSASLDNLFFYNYLYNLSSGALLIDNLRATNDNLFNTTVSGAGRGNYYLGIESFRDSLTIIDANWDGYGDSGASYPYNSTNSGGKSAGLGADYGPITPRRVNATISISPALTYISTNVSVSGRAYLSNGSYTPLAPVMAFLNGTLITSAYGTGSDGALTISTASTQINNYTYLAGNESAGDTVITVNSASNFSANDEILIIQMQNTSGGLAGLHEYASISSVSGTNITISSPLANAYYSGTFASTTATAAQIVNVPHYTNVTINSGASLTAAAWNGYTGGIVVFRVQDTLNVSGAFNASGKGFRKGSELCCNNPGYQGESYQGIGTTALANNFGGGGGGYGANNGAGTGGGGGAGGGYAAAGTGGSAGAGGTSGGTAGASYGLTNLSLIHLGSGGGASGDYNGGGQPVAGGDGGGIILVHSKILLGAGNLTANGNAGVNGGDGGGGGGSGGSIYLVSTNLNLSSLTVTAAGGTGGTAAVGGAGGAGSAGRIRLDYAALLGTASPANYNGSYNDSVAAAITNATGYYTFNFTAPAAAGNYTLAINTSHAQILGQNSTSFYAAAFPAINSTNATPSPQSIGYFLNISANITQGTHAINRTWVEINNVNYTMYNRNSGEIYWNDTINLTTSGLYSYRVFANDSNRFNATPANSTAAINEFLNMTLSISPEIPIVSTNVSVFGRAYLSNGTNAPSAALFLYLDGARAYPPGPAWFDANFSYRMPFNLTERSGNSLADFQFTFSSINTSALATAGKMLSNCTDIRFADSSGTELNYWVEKGCNTTNTTIWVRGNLSASATATLYMYYGNNTPVSSKSNQSATYILYDEFDQASLDPRWSTACTGGAISLAGGYAYPSDFGGGVQWIGPCISASLPSNISINEGYEAVFNVYWQTDGAGTGQLFTGLQNGSKIAVNHMILDGDNSLSHGGHYLYDSGGTIFSACTAYSTSCFGTGWHEVRLLSNSTILKIYTDGSSSANYSGTFNISGIDRVNVTFMKYASDGASTMRVGNVSLRKYSGLPPLYSFLSEESPVITTNATGHYNYTFTAPSAKGTHPIILNSTIAGFGATSILGQNATSVYVTSLEINNCTNLVLSGATYSVNESFYTPLSSSCINFTADSITLDCRGRSITGQGAAQSSGIGINATTRLGITIKNCPIQNFSVGISLNRTNSSTVLNTTIANSTTGLQIEGTSTGLSSGNSIQNVTARTVSSGIIFQNAYTARNAITQLTISNSTSYGVLFNGSHSNNISGVYANISAGSPSHGLYIENYADNNTLDCLGGLLNGSNSSGSYGIYSSAFNSTVKNCIIDRFETGIAYSSSSNGTIQNNTALTGRAGGYGILINSSSSFNLILNNTGFSNRESGILVLASSNNTIRNSTGSSALGSGISINLSSVQNTIAASNGTSGSGFGLYVSSGNFNIIANSTGASTSGSGLYISSNSTNITDSTFSGVYGLFARHSASLRSLGNSFTGTYNAVYINGTSATANSSFNFIENNTANSIINLTAFTYDNFGCGNTGATVVDSGTENSIYPGACTPTVTMNLTPEFVAKGANVTLTGLAEFGGIGLPNKAITIYFNRSQVPNGGMSPSGPPQTNATGWFNYTINATNVSWTFGTSLYASGQYNVSANFTQIGRTGNGTKNMTVFEFYPRITANKSGYKPGEQMNVSITLPTDAANYPYAAPNAISACIGTRASPSGCGIANLTLRTISGGIYTNETNLTSVTDGNYSVYMNVSVNGIALSNSTNITVDNTAPIVGNITTSGLNIFNYTAASSSYSVTVNATDNVGILAVVCDQNGANTSASAVGAGSNAYSCTLAAPSAGNYNITVYVNDSAGNTNSTRFEMSTVATTTASMLPQAGNLNSLTINDLQAGYYVIYNITMNNTGSGKAYRLNVSMTQATNPSYITTTTLTQNCTQAFINYTGGNCTFSFNITVNEATPQATYYLYFKGNFTNNDITIGTTSEKYAAIAVTGNPTLQSADYNISINHSTTGRFSISLNSTGNDNVGSTTVSYLQGGGTLPSSWVAFAPEAFASINLGVKENLSVNITVPTYYAPGNYTGHFDVNTTGSNNISINISVNVPAMHAWTLTPYNQTNTTGLSSTGPLLTAYLNNSGNVELNFTIGYTGSFAGASPDPGTNPATLKVRLGELYNFTPNHSGSPTSGIWNLNITFTNLSATPTANYTIMNLEAQDQPPVISSQINISPSNRTDANVQLTINFTVTDDQSQVNAASIHCNFTLSSTANVSASAIAGCANCYKCQYTPTQGGNYTLQVRASDNGGKMQNASRNLTIYGTTSVLVTTNTTSVSITDVNQSAPKYIRFTLYANNTGQGTAKSAVGFGQEPAGWGSTIANYSNISNNTRSEANITISIPAGTARGTYYTYAKVNWTNPDNTNSTNTSSTLVEMNVLGNPVVVLPEDFSVDITQNTNTSTIILVNSTGNDQVSSINLTCKGVYCTTFGISFNESYFNLSAGSSKRVNISISAPAGQAYGPYPIPINATASQTSGDVAVLTVNILHDYSWSLSRSSINLSSVVSSSGSTSIVIANSGNEQLSFNFNLTSNATHVLSLGNLTGTILKLSNYTLNLSYSAPASPGNYYGNLTLNETGNSTAVTIPVEFRVFAGSLNISPNATVKQQNILSGDAIHINATVFAGDNYINENVTFTVLVNGTSCPISSYANFTSQNRWAINCIAPAENDGHWHNLTITANYSTLNILITNTTQQSLHYRDVSAPVLLGSRINITGTSARIQLNVSDNVNVTNVSVYISQLSSNATINKTTGYTYEYNLSSLSAGDYDVRYWFNDTGGNANSSTDYFEIWNDASFAGDMLNSTSQAVVSDFRLYRPGTTRLLQNFSTNASGQYSATIHSRTYDANIYSSQIGINITLNGIELASYSDSFDFDGVGKRETNLVNGVNGVGIRSNASGNATILLAYNSGDLSTSEDYLKIYKCGSWNFSTKTCSGTWSQMTSVVDKVRDRVSANATQFADSDREVAYVLGESQPTSGQPDISVSSPDVLTLQHNRTGSASFAVTSSGTGNALGVTLVCVGGTICEMPATQIAPTSFSSITQGAAETVQMNVSIPYAFVPGTYLALITAYGEGISNKSIQLQVVVPTNASWTINQTYFNATVGTGETPIGYASLRSYGNVNFSLAFATNDTFAYANESAITLPKNTSSPRTLKILANATSSGNRSIVITVSNSSSAPASLQLNVSLNVVNFTVSLLSPTGASPVTSATSSTTLNITARAYLDGTELTSGVNWSATVGGSTCNSASYSYTSGSWAIACSAPDISTLNNTLVAQATYGNYSGSDSEGNAVVYTDTSPPTIVISAPSQYRESTVPISILVTDNAAVSNVSANITHPNGSVYNLSLTFSNPNYINNFATGSLEYGNYRIRVRANDTSGLNSTNTSTFNIIRGGYIAGNFTGPNGTSHTGEVRLYDTAGNLIFAFNASGVFNSTVNATDLVNLEVRAFGQVATLNGVNISNNISDIFRLDEMTPTYVGGGALKAIAVNNITANYSNGSITMDYTNTNYASESSVGLYKCTAWNFGTRACTSGWERLSSVSIDRINHKISANISSYSAYAVAEYICGDAVCHSAYGESNANCPQDCTITTQTVQVTTGGSGSSNTYTTVEGASEQQLKDLQQKIDELKTMQPGSDKFQKQISLIEELYKNLSAQLKGGANISAQGMQTITNSIYFELYPGEETTTSTTIRSTLAEKSEVKMRVLGNVKPYVSAATDTITIEPYGENEITLFVSLPTDTKPGVYYGSVEFENDIGGTIQVPFNLRVLQEKDRLLDLKIQPVDSQVEPGGKLRIETNIYNLGEARRVDAQLKIQMIDQATDKIIGQMEEALAIETSLSSVKTMDVPNEAVEGKYVLRAVATYPVSAGLSREAISVSTIQVRRSLTPLFIFLFVIVLAGGGYVLWKRREREKKRFLVKIDFAKLPQFDDRAAFLGKVAETNVRAAFPIDRLVMHALVAGASGSGKTVAAQAMVEEVLKKKVAVIVFDPTAQWTGFLRKNTTKEMLDLYPAFGMGKSEATAFPGNIYLVKDPNQKLNIKDLMKPGEISIFTLSGFKSTDIEVLVYNTIEEIFSLKLEESKELKLLVVFDEVHRLLPKFGGTGKGFTNIERAVREFRKWGVGMLLSSQVLSDFVGEIKTNISTEIQLRTKYEEDLNRIKMKYGDDILKYIVKSPVGVGMIQNAEFNRGNPYFISFRPLLHSIVRLSDKSLETYQKYNERIAKIIDVIDALKAKEVDVFDVELELKLARDKLNKGSFEVVEIYLESLEKKLAEMKKKGT